MSLKISRRTALATAASAAAAGAAPIGSARAQQPFVPFANKSLDFYFFVVQQEAVKRAVEQRGWRFQATNASFDNTTQLRQWQTLLLSQPTAIISDPIDSQAIVSAIRRYNTAGIPVGIIDTPATGGNVAITVDFDNFQGGVMAANAIIERLRTKYGSPRGTVLNCYGALQSVAWRLRKEGMDGVFAQHPEINYLARPTEGELDNMLAVTTATLAEFPDLDAVHAPSDTPSRGIVTALQQRDRWKRRGEDGHVIFVNIDGEPVALDWIKEGFMDAEVAQDPIAYAQITVEMLERYSMKGEAVPLGPYENKTYYWEKGEIKQSDSGPSLVIPPYLIDETNAADPRHWGAVAFNDWGMRYS